MPILHIRALPSSTKKVKKALKAACLAISKTYDCEPNQVWATWEEIKPGYYYEGETFAKEQPKETHPPIVKLTCFEGKTPEEIEELLLITAKTISESLGIPNNIFVSYHEAKSGTVVAGNGVVRKRTRTPINRSK